MQRRDFCAGLGVAIIALPSVARAGQTGKPPRVGMLWHAANEIEEAPYLGAFRRGMKALGYVEGQNVELVLRFADEKYERFDTQAAELVQLKVDLIYAVTPPAALAAQRATKTIPVVFLSIPDPVSAVQAAARAFKRGFGAKPVFIRMGGSIPVMSAFQEALGVELVAAGFGLPDDRLHSPNEKFDLSQFEGGIRTTVALLEELA